MNKKITLTEISNLLGVSEGQLLKNWKKYSSKLDEYGITKEGRGKKATYYIKDKEQQLDDKNIYQLAYMILQDVFKQKDIKNILKFLEIIMCNTTRFYTNKDYSNILGLSEKTIELYRKILRENDIICTNETSHQKYFGVMLSGEHIEISQDDYSFIYRKIEDAQITIHEDDTDKRLFEANEKLRAYALRELGLKTVYTVPRLEISPRYKNNQLGMSILYNAILYSKGDYK